MYGDTYYKQYVPMHLPHINLLLIIFSWLTKRKRKYPYIVNFDASH